MSAHPFAEPHFVDRSNVQANADGDRLRDGRQPVGAPVKNPVPDALEGVPALNSWVMSPVRSCLDRTVAGLVLLILAPVLLGLILVVRMSSPGPSLFRQRRAGRNREDFILYKFRSMRGDHPEGPAITVSGDRRITRVGAFLRRYKLDELPQFWNVLKGNMSLVGPRPKLPHHEGLDLPYRPGITGMATLAFREEEKVLAEIPREQLDAFYEICIKPRKAELDLEYMRNATLGSDLKLLWRTGASCLFGPDELSLEESERLRMLVAAWLDLHQDRAEPVPSEVGVG